MKYNELKVDKQKTTHRKGRGISSGRGKTAGRGTKGQNSRKSGGVRPGFEGGQMPLYMRLPKLRGFRSIKPKAQTVFTYQLNSIGSNVIDLNTLFEAGLITSPRSSVKLILKGELTAKKTVKLPIASSQAIAAIEKAGGNFEKDTSFRTKSLKAPSNKI